MPRVAWFLWMVGMMVILAYTAARAGNRGTAKGQGGPPGPNECLTDRSCADGWRCYAVPKDDPFVTSGICRQLCEGDLQCPPQFRCEAAVAGDHQVLPMGARGGKGAPLGVCVECGEEGCKPN